MSIVSVDTLKNDFVTGDIPTQQNFADLIDTLSSSAGTQGPQGNQGYQGAASTVQGPQGYQGAEGINGIIGVDGTQGPQGYQGTQGINVSWKNTWNGTTSYSQMDSVSYNGSSYVCIASISAGSTNYPNVLTANWALLAAGGSQGSTGTQGPQGAQGAASTVQGPQGTQGAAGTNGTNGTQGAQGAQGPAGTGGGSSFTLAGIQTSNFTAAANTSYLLQGTLTIALPVTPSLNDIVEFVTIDGSVGTTLSQNGNVIMGVAQDLVMDAANVSVKLQFSNATYGWILC